MRPTSSSAVAWCPPSRSRRADPGRVLGRVPRPVPRALEWHRARPDGRRLVLQRGDGGGQRRQGVRRGPHHLGSGLRRPAVRRRRRPRWVRSLRRAAGRHPVGARSTAVAPDHPSGLVARRPAHRGDGASADGLTGNQQPALLPAVRDRGRLHPVRRRSSPGMEEPTGDHGARAAADDGGGARRRGDPRRGHDLPRPTLVGDRGERTRVEGALGLWSAAGRARAPGGGRQPLVPGREVGRGQRGGGADPRGRGRGAADHLREVRGAAGRRGRGRSAGHARAVRRDGVDPREHSRRQRDRREQRGGARVQLLRVHGATNLLRRVGLLAPAPRVRVCGAGVRSGGRQGRHGRQGAVRIAVAPQRAGVPGRRSAGDRGAGARSTEGRVPPGRRRQRVPERRRGIARPGSARLRGPWRHRGGAAPHLSFGAVRALVVMLRRWRDTAGCVGWQRCREVRGRGGRTTEVGG